MRAKVIKEFYDKEAKCYRKIGDTFEADSKRLTVLENAGVAEQFNESKRKEPRSE